MLCAIFFHELLHCLDERFFVLQVFHINEVNNDNSADVAQAHLPGDFFCCFQVDLQYSVILVRTAHFVAAVHVDCVHGLGMFHD